MIDWIKITNVYRSRTLFDTVDKVYEQLPSGQVNGRFNSELDPYLSGYRKSKDQEHIVLDI